MGSKGGKNLKEPKGYRVKKPGIVQVESKEEK